MGPESPRITELRRRVESDPSSIAFAQLAEEYRRAGDYESAERYCRTGLTRHPAYLSARVTLGRTLIELNKLDEAELELQQVLAAAPDNLAALRGVAEVHQRLGRLDAALEYFRRALALSRHDPDLEELVERLSRTITRPARPSAPPAESLLDFDDLLESLGMGDRAAPPIVEALLEQSVVPAAPPAVGDPPSGVGLAAATEEKSPVVLSQPSVPQHSAVVEEVLGGPEPSAPNPGPGGEPDWMFGPLPDIGSGAFAHSEADASVGSPETDYREPGRSFGQTPSELAVSWGQSWLDSPDADTEPAAPRALLTEASAQPERPASDEARSSFARPEPPTSFGETVSASSPTPTESQPPDALLAVAHTTSAAGPEGPSAETPESVLNEHDSMILDELEAWLQAIKR